MLLRRRDLQQIDLDEVLEAASEAASRAGVTFEHRFEEIPPASCLVVSSHDPATAQVIVSGLEPGVVYLDIGAGMHGEWLLRSTNELANALADLGAIFEAVFRGDAQEQIRRVPRGRHSIRGFVETPEKTYRFRHHAVGLTAEAGLHRYAPYPPISQ
jgi:hypothetical protein